MGLKTRKPLDYKDLCVWPLEFVSPCFSTTYDFSRGLLGQAPRRIDSQTDGKVCMIIGNRSWVKTAKT